MPDPEDTPSQEPLPQEAEPSKEAPSQAERHIAFHPNAPRDCPDPREERNCPDPPIPIPMLTGV